MLIIKAEKLVLIGLLTNQKLHTNTLNEPLKFTRESSTLLLALE